MLIQWGFAKKAGAWINFDASLLKDIKENTGIDCDEKVQGMDRLRDMLEQKKEVCSYLFNKFKSALVK
jgi:hypothetical protein